MSFLFIGALVAAVIAFAIVAGFLFVTLPLEESMLYVGGSTLLLIGIPVLGFVLWYVEGRIRSTFFPRRYRPGFSESSIDLSGCYPVLAAAGILLLGAFGLVASA